MSALSFATMLIERLRQYTNDMRKNLKLTSHVTCVLLAAFLGGCAAPRFPTTDRASAELGRAARMNALQARSCCDSWETLIPIAKVSHGDAPIGFTVGLWPFQSVGRFAGSQSFYALLAINGAAEGDTLAIWGHPNSDGQAIVDTQRKELESEQFFPRVIFLDEKRAIISAQIEQTLVPPDAREQLVPQTRARVPRGAAYAVVHTSPDLIGQRYEGSNLSFPLPIPVGNFVIVSTVKLETKNVFVGGITGALNASLMRGQ
jgi:hypothetical protein